MVRDRREAYVIKSYGNRRLVTEIQGIKLVWHWENNPHVLIYAR
jgi:hypothetical protein